MFDYFSNLYQNFLDAYQGKAKVGQKRSPKWAKAREKHLKKEPVCQVCGNKDALSVHHVLPFSLFPQFELTPENLVTLCESKSHNCHLIYGHLLNFKSYNPFCREDVQIWRHKIKSRP